MKNLIERFHNITSVQELRYALDQAEACGLDLDTVYIQPVISLRLMAETLTDGSIVHNLEVDAS